MNTVIRFFPSAIGAVAAFLVLKVLDILNITGMGWELVVFLLTFFASAFAVDKALRAYGKDKY